MAKAWVHVRFGERIEPMLLDLDELSANLSKENDEAKTKGQHPGEKEKITLKYPDGTERSFLGARSYDEQAVLITALDEIAKGK